MQILHAFQVTLGCEISQGLNILRLIHDFHFDCHSRFHIGRVKKFSNEYVIRLCLNPLICGARTPSSHSKLN